MSTSVAVLGSNRVPLTYTVPVPGTLTPIAASAVFNGAAAATFVPCLSFYDSDGNLIARATSSTVAAGGSAEVSWFPGGLVGSVSDVSFTEYTVAGTYTYTIPTGARLLTVDVVGAGGGGGGFAATGAGQGPGASGGGGGAWVRAIIPASLLPASVSVVVGAGGLGGFQPGNGSFPGIDGAASKINYANGHPLISANGGKLGTVAASPIPGGAGGASAGVGGVYTSSAGTAGGIALSGATGGDGTTRDLNPGGGATGGGAGGGTTGTGGAAFAGGKGGAFIAADGTTLIAGAVGGTLGNSTTAGGRGADGSTVKGRDVGGAGGGGGGGCNSSSVSFLSGAGGNGYRGGGGCNSSSVSFLSGGGGNGYRGGGGGGAGDSNAGGSPFTVLGGNGGDGYVAITAWRS